MYVIPRYNWIYYNWFNKTLLYHAQVPVIYGWTFISINGKSSIYFQGYKKGIFYLRRRLFMSLGGGGGGMGCDMTNTRKGQELLLFVPFIEPLCPPLHLLDLLVAPLRPHHQTFLVRPFVRPRVCFLSGVRCRGEIRTHVKKALTKKHVCKQKMEHWTGLFLYV